jgi:linoleoyl-CoA desaturase
MSDYIWHIKHDVYHHTYTNVFELDEALKEGDALRLSADAPWKWYHQYQNYTAPFIYALFTIFWAFFLDFEKLFRYNAYGNRKMQKHPRKEVLLFWVTKLYYIIIAFVIPFLLGFGILQIVGGFLIVHVIAGSIITHVLQVEHLNTSSELVSPDKKGLVHKSWAKNQLEGTANFSCRNRLFNWYIAGVNYQVEHHLFPRINAVHYPAISAIVKETAEEFGLKYICFDSFGEAVRSHYRLLKILGRKEKTSPAYE